MVPYVASAADAFSRMEPIGLCRMRVHENVSIKFHVQEFTATEVVDEF